MITSRSQYYYVTGDLDEIKIDGSIMTRRADKKVLRGEDIAFIKELTRYRELAIGSRLGNPTFSRSLSLSNLGDAISRYNSFIAKPMLFDNGPGSAFVFYRDGSSSASSETPLTAEEWVKYYAGESEESRSYRIDNFDSVLRKDRILKMIEGFPRFSRIVKKADNDRLFFSTSRSVSSNGDTFKMNKGLKVDYHPYWEEDYADITNATAERDLPGAENATDRTLIWRQRAFGYSFNGYAKSRVYHYRYPDLRFWSDYDESYWKKGMLGGIAIYDAFLNIDEMRILVSGIDANLFESVIPIYKIRATSYYNTSKSGNYWRTVPDGSLNKNSREHIGFIVGRNKATVYSSGFAAIYPLYDLATEIQQGFGFHSDEGIPEPPVYGGQAHLDHLGSLTYGNGFSLLSEYKVDIEEVYYIGILRGQAIEI